jgi:DUF4097 and DUF4098 domain-containing protein YvlB
LAQDQGTDRVVIPARNGNHPRKVDISGMMGAITVKAYDGKEVIVESAAGKHNKTRESNADSAASAAGMRRLDLGMGDLRVEENDNVVTVRAGRPGGNVTVMVPADTSVKAHSMNGAIEIEGVKGDFELESMNGRISLKNVSGSVLAHTMNGAIEARLDGVDPSKSLSFSSMNGAVDVTLPADFKGNVKLRTDHGAIYSDFELGAASGGTPTIQPNGTPDGKFRVKMDKTISGTINGGGVEISVKTYNGAIYLRKKK